jgi:hypothetical protein
MYYIRYRRPGLLVYRVVITYTHPRLVAGIAVAIIVLRFKPSLWNKHTGGSLFPTVIDRSVGFSFSFARAELYELTFINSLEWTYVRNIFIIGKGTVGVARQSHQRSNNAV